MPERTRRPLLAAAALLAACAGASGPYRAPALSGGPVVGGAAAERLLVLVQTEADERVTPPWLERLERAGRAVDGAV